MWSRWLNKLRTWIWPAAADSPASAERYRLIASVMSDYVFSLEYAPNGEIKEQWISGAFSAITGYTREEFFARGGWVTILHPDDREQDDRDMAQLRANQKVVTEVRIIHKEGHIRWVRAYAHPQWDNQRQQLLGLYGAIQDITESKQIEASLRQREAILQVVADAANLFLQTADWRLNIDLMLERLGRTINATHAYVFEHFTNPQGEWLSTMKYEWASPGYASELGQPDFQEISLNDEEFIQYFQTLKNGEPYVGHLLSFLPIEREYFHSLGIKAILEVPLFVGGRWWGTIGFDDVEHEREWSNAEVDALKIAAGILSGAIEREQADQTLRQSESLYRRAIETAGAVPYYRDRITPSYQFMGEGIRQITGYGPEDMTPTLFESLVQEAVMLGDSKGLTVMEAGELAIEGKISIWKCDMRLVLPDGQTRWVNDSSVELIGSQGVSYGSIGILQDVTERKQVEANLRQREAILEIVAAAANTFLKIPEWSTEFWHSEVDKLLDRLGTTLKASHVYIFENHPLADGSPGLSMRYEWAAPGFVSELGNPRYLNMRLIVDAFETWNKQVPQGEPYIGDDLHLSPEEMKNLNLRGIYALLDVPIFIDGHWWGTIGFDEMAQAREWSNAEVDALVTAANLLGATIKRRQMDSLLQNQLHQRQTLISELEAKNAELERFTYTVSHDLRSPLVTIKGFLGYLERDVTAGNLAAFRKDMQRIGLAADRMDNLLKDLLELSRIGRIGHKPQALALAEVVHEAQELVHGRLQQRGITVQVEPDLPVVYGDKPRLTEVVQNLLDNAAKYMGHQTEPLIEIGAAGVDGDNKVIFFVRDNGLGIDPQYHERIFGLFDKLDANSEGTGVGLALVKRIVEFHRGRIWVESQGVGHGSTFYFTLPVVIQDSPS